MSGIISNMGRKTVKKVLTYTAIFEPDPDGGYVVSVPMLPGCVTQGGTFEEAVRMVEDAIGGYIAVLKEEGIEIPVEEEPVVITKVRAPNPFYTSA